MTDAPFHEVPWIGRVHVQPSRPDALGDNRGAFVNAVALAVDADDYRQHVHQVLDDLGIFVIEFSDEATVSDYAAEDRISYQMKDLIDLLSDDAPVQLDTFFAYRDHDA